MGSDRTEAARASARRIGGGIGRAARAAVAAVLLLALALASATTAAADDRPRVLGLTSFDALFPSTADIVDGWRAALGDGFALTVENLGSADFDQPAHWPAFAELLRAKFAEAGPPDIVLVADDPALAFALDHQDDLLGGAPIYASGVIGESLAERGAAQGAWVLTERLDFNAAITLARSVHPAPLERLVVILPRGAESVRLAERFRRARAEVAPEMTVRELRLGDLTFAELDAALRAEDGGATAVFAVSYFVDAAGVRRPAEAASEAIVRAAAAAGAPIYRFWLGAIRRGVVGGAVNDNRAAATVAAEKAVANHFRGARPNGHVADPSLYKVTRSVLDHHAALARGLLLDAAGPTVAILNAPPPRAAMLAQALVGALAIGIILLAGLMVLQRLRLRAAAERTLTRRLEEQEKAIGESRRLLESLLSTAPIAIEIVRGDGEVALQNDEGARLMRPQVVGTPYLPLADAATLRREFSITPLSPDEEPVRRALAGEIVFAERLSVERPGECSRRLHMNAAPVRGPGGAVVCAIVAAVDITRERDAIDAERRGQLLLDRILTATRSGVAALDADGRVLLSNPAARRLLASATSLDAAGDDRLDGRNFRDAATLEPLPPQSDPVRRAIEGGARVRADDPSELGAQIETYALGPSEAEMRWLRLSFRRVSGPGSLCVVLAVDDVTDEMRTRRALEVANEELTQFAYIASHDLQEPFRKIRVHADLLSRTAATNGAGEPDRAGRGLSEPLDVIRRAAERGQTLVSRLLEYARVGARPLSRTTVVLRSVLDAALTDAADSLSAAGAQVRVSGDLDVALNANATMLRQVFDNLIGNAVKYRRPDLPLALDITAAMSNGRLRVSIEDNGLGFDPSVAERIFEPFQRAHGRDVANGSGVGLAIVAKAATRHGWRVWAEGAPNQGARFIIDAAVCSQPEETAA